MKKLLLILALVSTVTGCTTRTSYGECIGVNETEDPAFEYSISGWNVAMGVIFSETIVVPLVVIFNDVSCPVRPKVLPTM